MKRLCLTFDDGLLNTYQVAYPILRDLDIKATVFVVTGILTGDVGSKEVRPNDNPPAEFMHDELDELARSGWEIGSHSHTHRVFDTLTDAEAEQELVTSFKVLAEYEPKSFAFPAGHGHFTSSQLHEATKLYSKVRNVSWHPKNYPPLWDAYPVDDYPSIPLEGETVVTCHHRILEPDKFRGWLESLKSEGVEFVRLRDL